MHSLRSATKKCAWRDCLARSRLTGLRLSASFTNANLHPRLRPQLTRAQTLTMLRIVRSHRLPIFILSTKNCAWRDSNARPIP